VSFAFTAQRMHARTYLATLAAIVAAHFTVAEPTDAHEELKAAAEFAISSGNADLLTALFKAGLQIDEPLDDDTEWTALHVAVVHNQIALARLLRDNGAWLDSRDKYGKRPIDHAFAYKQTQMCEILAKGDQHERLISGIPVGALDEILATSQLDTNLVFISFNQADPADDLMKRLAMIWPYGKPISSAIAVPEEERPHDVHSTLKDKTSGEFGHMIILNVERQADAQYEWSLGWYAGSLAAGSTTGVVERRYGYWICTTLGGHES
jgi:hypothetical protein